MYNLFEYNRSWNEYIYMKYLPPIFQKRLISQGLFLNNIQLFSWVCCFSAQLTYAMDPIIFILWMHDY